MKVSRDWATPVTMGAFLLMAVTGGLMFFHLDSGLNKPAHEWLGWLMIAGVAAHVVANFPAFKRYLTTSRKGQFIVLAFALLLAGSFISLPSEKKDMSPPLMAMQAMLKAPLVDVARLAGKPLEQVVAELKSAGIEVVDPQAPLSTILPDNRRAQGRAIAVVLGEG